MVLALKNLNGKEAANSVPAAWCKQRTFATSLRRLAQRWDKCCDDYGVPFRKEPTTPKDLSPKSKAVHDLLADSARPAKKSPSALDPFASRSGS